MRKERFHIISIIFLIWNFSFAQQYTNYSTKDGLPSNHVYRLTQDNKGFIWAITDKGIARFNGTEFKIFKTSDGLPTNDIWDIRITPDNRIWYFSKSTSLGYIENGRVFSLQVCDSEDILYPSTTIQYGNTIILGGNEWFTLKGTCWSAFKKDTIAIDVASSAVKRFKADLEFIKSKSAPIFKASYIRGKDSIVGILDYSSYGVLNLTSKKMYRNLYPDDFSTEDKTLTRFHFVNNQIQISGPSVVGRVNDEYELDEIVKIPSHLGAHFSMIDKKENIWSATFTNGIYKLPQVNRRLDYFKTNNKIRKIDLLNNRVIVTVHNQGFYEYDSSSTALKPIIEKGGYIYDAVYINALKAYFFISTDKIIRLQNGRFKQMNSVSRPADIGIRLAYYNGYLYGTTNRGINKINPDSFEVIDRFLQVGIRDSEVFNNQLILATSDGLKTLNDEGIQSVSLTNSGLHKPILSLDKISEKELLVSTDGFGTYLTDLVDASVLEGSEFLSAQDSFIETTEIWLAAEIGVLQYQKIEGEYKLVRTIDVRDGLPSKKTNSVVVLDDKILVATDNGLVVLPKQVKAELQLLDLYFDKASFDDEQISDQQHAFKFRKGNTTSFSVAAIDFGNDQSDLTYQYKLMPTQETWIETKAETINFNDLQPNSYTLLVKKGSIEERLSFEVTPLWWQTSWFKTVAILLALVVLGRGLFVILKTLQKKQTRRLIQEKELAQIQLKALRSQLNPHFVFNSLAAIQYYLNNNDFDASEKYLVKFSKLIRTFFELSKENEITISDEITLLKNYLDIEKLRFRDKFEYSIVVDPKLNGTQGKIPTMLLQPIVENAVNHGIFNKETPGKVTIDFIKVNNDEVQVSISDNGVGFVNTKREGVKKIKSSNVLRDRLYYLNRSQRWRIEYGRTEAFPELKDKGNISTFNIKNIQ
jgi:hypothetical protein